MRTERIQALVQAISRGLYEKEETLRLAVLAAISGQNVFLHGAPGAAKSMIAGRVPFLFRDARSFSYLLGRFSTPDELFGPVSISKMKDHDRYERVVEGFLPAAEIVFLDEIWNASSPILNTLLTAINERRFRNGAQEITLPLRTVIAAAGTMPPDDPAFSNLWDRFLLRVETHSISDEDAFTAMLLDTENNGDPVMDGTEPITTKELATWHQEMDHVAIPTDIVNLIIDVRERIARHNRMNPDADNAIVVSDRRWKQIAHLLRASAFLNDRSEVDVFDCILMRHCLWSHDNETDTINTIIEEALHRYSTSGRFDAEAFRQQLEETLDAVHAARYEVLQKEVQKPLEYRGEYYQILDYIEDLQTLIWIGDFQNLSSEHPTETDLFFYGDADDYAYSERLPVRLIDDVTVEIAESEFSIETVRTEQQQERPVDMDRSTREELMARLNSLHTETNEVIAAIRKYRESTSGEAVHHLFVHRSYAEIVTTGMDRAAEQFAALQLEIDRVTEELG
jgi:MoxR-like ATPase